jgi:hypothetical protein
VTRHTFLNIVLAILAVGLVGSVVYLETNDGESAGTDTTITTLTTTTIEPTTVAPTTTQPATTTAAPESTVAPTTAPPPTEPPTTLPPTTLPPPERPLVPVVVTSAGTTGERVGPTVYLLSTAGWSDIRGVNAAVPATATVVYFVDGFQNAAELMALDMSLPVTSVAPLATAPPVAGLGNAALVVYLGG